MEVPAAAGARVSQSLPVQAVQQQQHKRRGGGSPALQSQPLSRVPQQAFQGQQARSSQRRQLQEDAVWCWGCGRVGHRRGNQGCPARGVKCSRCGNLNHFAQHCRPSSRGRKSVHCVEVLTASESSLMVPATVEGTSVILTADSGSPVSILPRRLVTGDLSETEVELRAYGGQCLDVMGKKNVNMLCNGKIASVCVYVVAEGRALMGLDLMRKFGVNIVDNQVCVVSPAPPSPLVSGPIPGTGPASQPEAQPAILGYQHRVMVDPDVPPDRQPLRRLPLAVVDEVSAGIDELDWQGVVEKVSASRWVSPLASCSWPQEGWFGAPLC